MPANIVSRETPSQTVPSFDHRVTQCMSTVMVSAGNSRNDFQFHRRKTSVPSSIVNSHLSRGTRGVGPADRTGKSVVRYWPGSSFASDALRRPEKPREMVPMQTDSFVQRSRSDFAPLNSRPLKKYPKTEKESIGRWHLQHARKKNSGNAFVYQAFGKGPLSLSTPIE